MSEYAVECVSHWQSSQRANSDLSDTVYIFFFERLKIRNWFRITKNIHEGFNFSDVPKGFVTCFWCCHLIFVLSVTRLVGVAVVICLSVADPESSSILTAH